MSWAKLAISAYRSAKDVVDKPGWLNEEDYKVRIEMCRRCDLYNLHSKRCRECGCFMEVKARLAGSKCPISKW